MTSQIMYKCNYCGHFFETTSECLECENKHVVPDYIMDEGLFYYDGKNNGKLATYPRTIHVKMLDGSVHEYVYIEKVSDPIIEEDEIAAETSPIMAE